MVTRPCIIAVLHSIMLNVTHTRLTAPFPGLPGWAGTRKVKPIWISLKQETVSESGISWAICKSAPCSRQITTPAPHRSSFHRSDVLPAAQPTASKHWRHSLVQFSSTMKRYATLLQLWLFTAKQITNSCGCSSSWTFPHTSGTPQRPILSRSCLLLCKQKAKLSSVLCITIAWVYSKLWSVCTSRFYTKILRCNCLL